MPTRQELRSEETRQAILTAARRLFAQRGYESVTMRETAKDAGCSHTTIYIYFKDKEALLHTLSVGPLQLLRSQMESVLHDNTLSPDERLKTITNQFVEFCLANRNMYTIFFMTRATRVDDESPVSEINQLRNHLFWILRQSIGECVGIETRDDLVLAYSRIFFFTLHGILATYTNPQESLDNLMERLGSTFNLAVDIMLAGFKQNKNKEMNSYEG